MFLSLMATASLAGGGTLARPAAPTFTAEPGDNDGEVDITVSALPTTWGDVTVPGDDDSVLGILQWWNGSDGWQVLADPAATGAETVTLPAHLWGMTTTIRVRGVSDAGVEGIAASVSVQVPPVVTLGIGTMEIGSTFEVS